MKKLTSLNNDTVKFVKSLHNKKSRDEFSLFIAEGDKALEAALNFEFKIKYVFVLQGSDIKLKLDDNIIYSVNEKIMKKISTTDTVPRVLTVINKNEYKKSDIKNSSKWLLLDNIKDAGNLGTIIRSAVAFSIDGIILFGDCCDRYNSKVIRSSAGTFFQIPFLEYRNIDNLLKDFKDYKLISTDLHKKSDISLDNVTDNFILMLGSEADGISSELSKSASGNFLLPIKNSVESLNLSVSAGIILYELSKNY